MTDIAMPQLFNARARQVRPARHGRPTGVLGAISYGGVLLVWLGLFIVNPTLARQVFRERRADSPIPRRWGW